MSKVIIGIHGLANKPKQTLLSDYWRKSIAEGLQNVKVQNPQFKFVMVYWANYLYRHPMHDDPGYQFDNLYNSQPYLPAKKLKAYKDGWKDDLRQLTGKGLGPGVDWFKRKFGVDRLADTVLGGKLKDLDYYYQDKPVMAKDGKMKRAKNVLRQELIDTLGANKQHEIMLIAHSMGTIVAYDVLRILGHKGPKVAVKHFVTIGSPLGLPHVKQKIIEERKAEGRPKAAKLRTPSLAVGTWMNYADKRDPVALDSHLQDDYGPNDSKVTVTDDLVSNDYVDLTDEPNHHKSYGYLRTPELSAHIKAFLQ